MDLRARTNKIKSTCYSKLYTKGKGNRGDRKELIKSMLPDSLRRRKHWS